jgi:exodeoxyribonuclease VII small subunit
MVNQRREYFLEQKGNKEIKLEEAMDRLEQIIGMLQDGALDLDNSLEAFEEGIRLVRICQDKLDKAESRITMLIKENSGHLKEVPFITGMEEN